MPENKENFTKLDNTLLELVTHGYFTLNEIRVLLVILRHTSGWHRESVQMSTSDLSKMTGIQSRHVNTAVNGLKEKSVISIVQNRKTDVKEFYINTYDTFCHKTSFVIRHFLSQDLGQNLSQATPLKPLQSEGYSAPKENNKEKGASDDAQHELSSSSERTRRNLGRQRQQEADALFEKLWKLYPSKKGKAKVKPSQKIKLLSIGEDRMMRALNRYLEELKRDEWRSPQNGSTFFNSGYVDYLDDNYEQPQKIQSQPKPAGPRFNP